MSKFFKQIGLQFFAEPQPEPSPEPAPQPNPEPKPEPEPQPQPKTFTQEELNVVASREKKQGRNAVLRELGINPEDKGAIARYKALIEQSQSNEERLNTQLQTEQTEKADALARAEMAELKLAAIQAGANPKLVDDLVTLAKTRVTETKGIDKVLEEMKASHPMFYATQEPQPQGTGGIHNPPRGRGGQGQSIAERLAQKQQGAAKSSFFKNT